MPPDRRVDLALLAVAVAWGSSYLAAKDVATSDNAFGFLAIRFALAATGLVVVLGVRLWRIPRAELVLGALFGAILSVIFALETFGLTMTSASHAGLIISLTIVLTPLLQQWTQRTRLRASFYGATVVAAFGVVLLTQAGGLSAPGLGDLLMLLAAAARACHVVVMAQLSRERRLDPGRLTLVQICICLALFVTLAAVTGSGPGAVAARFSLGDWLITAYLALGCTVFAFVVQAWAVQRTSPARVSLLLGTEPLWAAAAGVLVAGDPVTLIGTAGAILVVTGTNWGRASCPSNSERASRRTRSRPPERPSTRTPASGSCPVPSTVPRETTRATR
ncbi:drug/metabolite transporter (DMT)-like permease [Mycolicibacterium sp. BK634]|nr:drug/metabolite transporter (DMT)-like permease [Mycolicibacterium sp. BK634]